MPFAGQATNRGPDGPLAFQMPEKQHTEGAAEDEIAHQGLPRQACHNAAMDRLSSTCLPDGDVDLETVTGDTEQIEGNAVQLVSHQSGRSSQLTGLPDYSGSAASAIDLPPSAKELPLKSLRKRRIYKTRSKQMSAEEEESRKQRRLQKNRATAAVSRERKRAQFNDLQSRVAFLVNDNERLTQELDCRDRQLESVKGKLASLTKGASGDGLSQHIFESAESKAGVPTLIDMPDSLQPDADCPLLKDHLKVQSQLVDTHCIATPGNHGDDCISHASLPLYSPFGGPLAQQEDDTRWGLHMVRQTQSPCFGGYTDLPPEFQQQAKLEPDFGGPVVSLGQQENIRNWSNAQERAGWWNFSVTN